MPGYSQYLHPLSPTLLLGLGQHADDHRRVLGAKASLFRMPLAGAAGAPPPATALVELDT